MKAEEPKSETALNYTFSHVLLYVKDDEASKRFYVDKLGLELLSDKSEWGLYTVGTADGFAISLHGVDEDEEGAEPILAGMGTEAIQFDFDVPDVDEVYERLQGRGVEFLRPPEDMPWGERHTWLRDPDGYIIGISSPVK